MLDKSKIYSGYSTLNGYIKSKYPMSKFKQVRILFEDDISYYVESLTGVDSKGHGVRYSVKKHCFFLKEISSELKAPAHNICPFCAV